MVDTAGRALGAASITLVVNVFDEDSAWFYFTLISMFIYLLFMFFSVILLKQLDRLTYIKVEIDKNEKKRLQEEVEDLSERGLQKKMAHGEKDEENVARAEVLQHGRSVPLENFLGNENDLNIELEKVEGNDEEGELKVIRPDFVEPE